LTKIFHLAFSPANPLTNLIAALSLVLQKSASSSTTLKTSLASLNYEFRAATFSLRSLHFSCTTGNCFYFVSSSSKAAALASYKGLTFL
jgi:hypothetical protein